MGVMIKAKEAKATNVYRLNKKGIPELVEVNQNDYSPVPAGYYRLQLVGVSEPFEMTGEYGTQTKVRLEWLVVASDSKKGRAAVNCRFSDMVNLALSEKSNLGKIVEALTGVMPEPNSELDLVDLLGNELEGTVTNSEKEKNGSVTVYTNLVYKSLVAAGSDDDEDNDDAPAPAKNAKAKSGNPILGDDDDE